MRGTLWLARIGRRGRIALAIATALIGSALGYISPTRWIFQVVLVPLMVLVILAVSDAHISAAGPLSASDRSLLAENWRCLALPADTRLAYALLKLVGVQPRHQPGLPFIAAPVCWTLPLAVSVVGNHSLARVTGALALATVVATTWAGAWRREVRSRPLRTQASERWIRGYVPVPPVPGAAPWIAPRNNHWMR